MKRLWIMLLMALSLIGMIPNTVSAQETEDPQKVQRSEDSVKRLATIFDKYVDPDYCIEEMNYMDILYRGDKPMWVAKRNEITNLSNSIVKGSKTQYEKIKAITMFVANHVYYRRPADPYAAYDDPCEVYENRIAVCEGYSKFVKALCDAQGIPSLTLESYYDHAWNAAYDREQKRWIFLDATACSHNQYDSIKDEWHPKAATEDYFDFPLDSLNQVAGHFPAGVGGIRVKKGGVTVNYELVTAKPELGYDYTKWQLRLTGLSGKNVKVDAGLEGIKVTDIRVTTNLKKDGVQTLDLSETSISRIDNSVFSLYDDLTSLKLPPTLKELGVNAFYGCDKLKEIDLSNTKLSSMDRGAFGGCDSARVIKLPSTLKKIGERAFEIYEEHPIVKTTLVTNLSKKQLGISDKKLGIWQGRMITNYNNTYGIRFMKNGAKKGKMSDLLCDRGSKVTLTANKFKRPGYKFKGWSTKKNGKGKIYKNRAKVKNIAKANKIVKLYACWKKIK